jgi:hypothetical protein
MRATSYGAFALGIAMAMLLFSCMLPKAHAEEPIILVVINTSLDGVHTASTVRVEAPPEGFTWITCFREFSAPAIRCYAVNPQTMELGFQDFKVKS